MSHHDAHHAHAIEVPRLGDAARAKVKLIAIVGVVLLAVTGVLGMMGGWKHFGFAWLVGATFVLSIGLGGLFFVILQHLTRAGWSVVVRRLAENAAATLPLSAVLFLPLLVPVIFEYAGVWHWVDRGWAESDPLVAKKVGYLNGPFFLFRCVVYFAAWILMARYFVGKSREQDRVNDPEITSKMQKTAAPCMLIFALTLSFGAFDLLMSLDPHWFSTIFGVYFFAGCTLSIFCTLVLVATWLKATNAAYARLITAEHFHDLGKWMFGFVFFWGYIAFSQFMLIWYADIPEETVWFLHRGAETRLSDSPWTPVTLALLIGHLLIPFPGLLSRHVKRNPKVLSFWAVWLLAMQILDLFWIIRPDMHHGAIHFGIIDVTAVVGLALVGLAYYLHVTSKHPLVPHRDPRLEESVALVNA